MLKLALVQIRRPNNYTSHIAAVLGPQTPDPTMDLSPLNIVKVVRWSLIRLASYSLVGCPATGARTRYAPRALPIKPQPHSPSIAVEISPQLMLRALQSFLAEVTLLCR